MPVTKGQSPLDLGDRIALKYCVHVVRARQSNQAINGPLKLPAPKSASPSLMNGLCQHLMNS